MGMAAGVFRGGLRLAAIVAALGSVGLPISASASFISGEMTFSGDIEPTGGTDLSDASGLLFPNADFGVDATTGDLSGIVTGDIGTISNFTFSPLDPNPVDPLFTIAGFSYLLDTVSVVFQDTEVIILAGSGVLSAAGFDDTEYDFNLTANMVTGELSNFSASIGPATVVPVPGAVVLFASALAGLGFARRRTA